MQLRLFLLGYLVQQLASIVGPIYDNRNKIPEKKNDLARGGIEITNLVVPYSGIMEKTSKECVDYRFEEIDKRMILIEEMVTEIVRCNSKNSQE